MSESENLSIRLLTTCGRQLSTSVKRGAMLVDLKKQLLASWPHDWPKVVSCSDLKFIYSGSFLKDGDVLSELRSLTGEMTIHLLIKKAKTKTPPLTVEDENGNVRLNEEAYFHFHGCSVSVEEIEQMKMVFDAKCDSNQLMTFDKIHSFLRTYWRFSKREQFIEEQREFPTDKLFQLKRRFDAQQRGLTFEAFLELFFLFDNATPDIACVHGERARVQQATEQLHNQLHPNTPFEQEIFDHIWQRVDRDKDNVLSCKELDMIYYIYAAHVTLKHGCDGLDADEDDNSATASVDAAPHAQKASA